MNRNKSLLYFDGETDGRVFKWAFYAAIALSVVAFVVAASDGIRHPFLFTIAIFVVSFIFGVFLLASQFPRIFLTDSAYDNNVRAFYEDDWKELAFKRLGIDESEVNEVAPIVLGGYEFEGFDRIKRGNDGIWRSNIFKFVAIFFSANELHCYTLRFNTLKEEMTQGTEVFFYEDIVSASTSSSIYRVKVGDKDVTISSETFKITTRGGTSFTVNIADAQRAQESVNAMRALLREKKQA